MYVFPYELLSNTQLFKILMGLHVSKDCISTIKGETRGKHDSEFLLNNLYAHRGIFSPLIASADFCSFFFLSIIISLPFFQITVISCDLSSYGHQRVCVWYLRVCAGVCGCALVCTCVHRCVQVYIHVRGWMWLCIHVHGCVQV